MAGQVMPSPLFTGLDDNGEIVPGGLLYSYAAGTSTPQDTYSDYDLLIPNSNPVVLNAAGRATVFLDPALGYKFVLMTATGVTLWTQDDIVMFTVSSIATEAAQDAVGSILTDTVSVDFTYDDITPQITADVLPAGVDHDQLLNFVADEHVAHTGVVLTAGAGLTGGGDISASRSFAVGAGALITVGADDVGITPASVDYSFIRAGTTPWTAAWSPLSGLAGAGLTHAAGVLAVGAGDLVTVAADTVGVTPAAADYSFIRASTTPWTPAWGLIADLAGTGLVAAVGVLALDTTNARNVDHSAVTLTAGDGLTGGGTIEASRTFAVGAGSLITVAADSVGVTPAAADYSFIKAGTTPWTPTWGLIADLAGAGLTAATGVLAVGGSTTISVAADAVSAISQLSITADASGLKLSGDAATPGNLYYYGTDGGGTKGWYVLPSGTMSGSGTQYYIPRFTAATTLADSVAYTDSGNTYLGITGPGAGGASDDTVLLMPLGSGNKYGKVRLDLTTGATGRRIEINGHRVRYFNEDDTLDDFWFMTCKTSAGAYEGYDNVFGISFNRKDYYPSLGAPGSAVVCGGAPAAANSYHAGSFLYIQAKYYGDPGSGASGDQDWNYSLQSAVAGWSGAAGSTRPYGYLSLSHDSPAPSSVTEELARFWNAPATTANALWFTPPADNKGYLGTSAAPNGSAYRWTGISAYNAEFLTGICVGFAGTPSADRVSLYDSSCYIEGGTAPIWVWDSGDFINYTRSTNTLSLIIGSAAVAYVYAGGPAIVGGLVVGFDAHPTAGEIHQANAKAIKQKNSGGTLTEVVMLDASNNLRLGFGLASSEYIAFGGYPVGAGSGGGATAIFAANLTGGTKQPAGATQVGWWPIKDSAATVGFVPIWR